MGSASKSEFASSAEVITRADRPGAGEGLDCCCNGNCGALVIGLLLVATVVDEFHMLAPAAVLCCRENSGTGGTEDGSDESSPGREDDVERRGHAVNRWLVVSVSCRDGWDMEPRLRNTREK